MQPVHLQRLGLAVGRRASIHQFTRVKTHTSERDADASQETHTRDKPPAVPYFTRMPRTSATVPFRPPRWAACGNHLAFHAGATHGQGGADEEHQDPHHEVIVSGAFRRRSGNVPLNSHHVQHEPETNDVAAPDRLTKRDDAVHVPTTRSRDGHSARRNFLDRRGLNRLRTSITSWSRPLSAASPSSIPWDPCTWGSCAPPCAHAPVEVSP